MKNGRETAEKMKVRQLWYISFAVVLLLSMVSALILYVVSLNSIERQTRETNRAMLQLMLQSVESTVDSMDRMADSITVSRDFAAIQALSGELSPAQRYKLFTGSKTLFKNMPADRFTLRRAVYLKNSGRVLNDTSAYQTLEQSYASYMEGIGLTFDEYSALLNSPHERDYLSVRVGNHPAILCIRSLPYTDERFNTNVLLLISPDAILDALRKAEWSGQGIVCVQDSRGSLLMSSDEAHVTPEMLDVSEEGEREVRVDGARYLCMSLESQKSSLRYSYIAPYEMIYSKASILRTMAAVIILCGLLAGILAVWFLVRYNYRPVQRILSSIPLRSDDGSNEYDIILRSIEEGQIEQLTLKEHLREKHAALGQEMLERFLCGRLSYNTSTYRMLESHGILLNRERYLVLSMSAPDFYSENADNVTDNVGQLFAHLLEEQLPGVSVYRTMADMNVAMVLGLDEAQTGNAAGAVEHTLTELRASYNVELTVGLSCAESSPAMLHELYRQAMTALEYGQTHESSAMIQYPAQSEQAAYCFAIEEEIALMEAVRNGKPERVRELLDGVLGKYVGHMDTTVAQCLRFDLIAACLRVFSYADSVMTRDRWQGEDAARRLMATTGMSELVRVIDSLMMRLCKALNEQRTMKKDNLSEKICQHIEANWSDESLSVASIAEKMDMHPSYISRLFKEERGIGLLEYINRYRVERAVDMLREEKEQPLSQMAQSCGFATDTSFIRVFKQYKGMTPGKFREESRKMSENLHSS